MPVYGVEYYIADSIADILTQTCQDFELIIVDDCTPDRSFDIAEELTRDDSRVVIVRHEQNKGLSQARNTGIRHATGSWIIFPDPDDRYDVDMLQNAKDALVSTGADLVVFAHTQEYYDASGKHLYDNPIELEEGLYRRGVDLAQAALKLEQQTHLGYAWNKAFNLDIIRDNQLLFEDDVPLIEDILFSIAYLHHCDSVATISCKPYHYAKRLKSNLTNAFVPNYFELHRRRIQEMRDFMEDSGALDDGAKATLGSLYARYILSSIEQNTSPQAHKDMHQQSEWLKRLFEDDLFKELILLAQAQDSKSLALCLEVLKSHNIPALLALGQAIHIVRTHGTTLYTKVKSGR